MNIQDYINSNILGKPEMAQKGLSPHKPLPFIFTSMNLNNFIDDVTRVKKNVLIMHGDSILMRGKIIVRGDVSGHYRLLY